MTSYVESVEELEQLYGPVTENARRKVAAQLTPEYHRWIEAARFCVLASVGREGTDASPRGDAGPVVESSMPGTFSCPTGTATTGSTVCATSSRTGVSRCFSWRMATAMWCGSTDAPASAPTGDCSAGSTARAGGRALSW